MKNKTLAMRCTLIAVMLFLCASALLGAFCSREEYLNRVAEQALQKLAVPEGSYDEHVLVLEGTSEERAAELALRLDAQLALKGEGDIATLTLPLDVCVEDVFEDRKNRDILSELTPEYYYTLDEISASDAVAFPNYPITDRYYSYQQNIPYLNIGNTWNVTKGKNSAGERVIVAVIDTGIDTDHSEFMRSGERIMSTLSYNSYTGQSVASYGWDVIEDDQGHGTSVAGVIAAQMNGTGVVGIAPDVELMVIKANETGSEKLSHSSIVNAIDYAVRNGAKVLSMSFSRETSYTSSYFEGIAKKGVIPVASSGNTGNSVTQYPAADPYVIGVGALAYQSWSLAEFSTYGAGVDLVAPGEGIYTAAKGGGYQYINGTSFSCPTVAAAVALYIAYRGAVGFEKLTTALYSSCKDLGTSGKDSYFGYGALQITDFLAAETVKLTLDYRTTGAAAEVICVAKDYAIHDLPIPAAEGALRFEGWYLDPRLTQKVNLTAGECFSANTTLYARWLEGSEGDFDYYVLQDGTVEITAYRGTANVLEIPAQIAGKRVTSIGIAAMKGNTDLKSLAVPLGVRTVGADAFAGCEELSVLRIDSLSVTRDLINGAACGKLCARATTIAVPASYGTPTTYIKNQYTYVERITIGETLYNKYAKHPSVWVQGEILKPRVACEEDGLARFACSTCGIEKIEVLSMHVECEWINQTPNSCTGDGLDIYRCRHCLAALDSRVIAAFGHESEGNAQTVAATCTEGGYTLHRCLTCAQQYQTDPKPSLGHIRGEWSVVSLPDKTKDGYEQILCMRCHTELSGRVLPAYTHLLKFEKDVSAITDQALEENYKIIVYCLQYYGALTERERAVVVADYASLCAKIEAYNEAAKQKNEALLTHTCEASSMLSELYEGLAALWYACGREKGKGA